MLKPLLIHGQPRHRLHRQPKRQSGMSLFIALIALVAMTLAAIGLMRSVDTTNLIAGNIAFKQSATIQGDTGVETAIQWLSGNVGALTVNNPTNAGNGYFATKNDPTDNNWPAYFDTLRTAGTVATLGVDADTGNTVSYVIHRMCAATGDPALAATGCVTATTTAPDCSCHGPNCQPMPCTGLQVYYRITARIDGPRNTTSYIQSLVLF